MELNYQYAHHSFDESETKSVSSIEDVLSAFDHFDWDNQVQKANELQKVSPTLTLIIDGNREMVWVSAYGEKSDLKFVSECYFPGLVSKWFGLSKKEGTVNLCSQEFSLENARTVFDLMLNKDYEGLRKIYA